jgi:hypothetical protein
VTTGASLRLRVEALALAAAVRIAVRGLPLKRVVSLLARVPRRHVASTDSVASCLEAARHAARRLAHSTCLFESLVALGLLARRGYRVELHVGARRVPDLESHAWVSIDGRPCDPESTAGYTAIWHVGPASGR